MAGDSISSPQILIVEPDELWGRGIRDALEVRGYPARLHRNPQGALKELKRGAPDLLILSSAVGEPAAFSLAKALRERRAVPAVLWMSSPREDGVWDPTSFFSCVSVLRRPYSVIDVLRAVGALLGAPSLMAAPQKKRMV